MSEVYVKEPATSGKVVLKTDRGDLDVELWCKECPKACRNFVQLCMEGYYDNTIFHRLIPGFIIQGGDATGSGEGGACIYPEGSYPDEFHSRLKFRYRGMLGVANAGRGTNTNGSQFFITLDRVDSFNGQSTLFGKVCGETVYNLASLAEVDCDKNDRPFEPPVIQRAVVISHPFDIEPRQVPQAVAAAPAEEKKKIAVVRAKARISVLASDDEDEVEEGGLLPMKISSAHDALNDARLKKESIARREAAATERPAERPAERGEKAERRPAAAEDAKGEKAAKRPRVEDEDSDYDEEAIIARRKEAAAEKRRAEIDALMVTLAAKEQAAEAPAAAAEEADAPQDDYVRGVAKRPRVNVDSIMGRLSAKLRAMPRAPKEQFAGGYDPKKHSTADELAGTFAGMARAAEEESEDEDTSDWLTGGLNFAVDSTKAFKLDESRGKAESLDVYDPLDPASIDRVQEELRERTRKGKGKGKGKGDRSRLPVHKGGTEQPRGKGFRGESRREPRH